NEGLRLDNVVYITPEIDQKREGSHVFAKDILLNITGASIGRCALVPDDFDVANINQHVLILRLVNSLLREYVHLVMITPYIFGEIMNVQVGGTKEGLSASKAMQLLIPLSPFTEQQRIVNKIKEIMPQLDVLGKDEMKLDTIQKSFPKKMKDSLLQSAIQGKLTEQLEADGDARDLLVEIQKEKADLIKLKKIKKEKDLPEITDDEIPFEVPENWCWVRLGDIGETNIGLTYKPSDISIDGTLVLRSGNIQNDKMDYSDNVYVSCDIPESKKCHVGDILICARNGSKKLVGKAAIIDQEGMTFGAFMALFRSPFNEYIHKYISSPYFRSDLDGVSTTTINQITQNNVKERLIPLPPLAEQHRIVERLDQLLPLCDALE
ncbi:MAG: restriction endonuclease subunit S, partial [Syntrophomonadaceae bacterium]|nr:restriction endonuclease subunit S [Syntrophomonadaceae bacterium]